jgi:RNA polymerase sigma factor (sigma-70 family)
MTTAGKVFAVNHWDELTLEPAISPKPGPAHEIMSLTTGMAKGQEEAYRQFYDLYFDRLLRYLLVLTANEERAREALQLTLLRVVRYAKPFGSEEAFWGWLTVLARTAAADEQRKSRRYLSALSHFFALRQPSLPEAVPDAETRLIERLHASLEFLSEDERGLITRKYLDREPVRNIARALHLTEKAVESRLVRARQKLKTLILEQLKNER